MNLPPKEGVGNAGCPLHPRPRVHLVVVERTRVTTSTPESPDVPARNGFNGFLRALPGDRAVLPPSPTDMFLSKAGWADLNSANLTPASGRQDHTTSPYAATSLVRSLGDRSQAFRQPALQLIARKTLPPPPHPIPTSVTIAIRPSVGRDAKVLDLIWSGGNKYFSENPKKMTRQPCQEAARRANHHSPASSTSIETILRIHGVVACATVSSKARRAATR